MGMGPDTKKNWPTDRRSQYNLNFNSREWSITTKCGLDSEGLGPRIYCSGKAQKQLYE
jgi:hypothetical protein